MLRLSADDSELATTDVVTVSVKVPTTEVFESSLSKRRPTREFMVTTGGGAISAALEARATGNGKNAGALPVLTLHVFDANGDMVGQATSPAQWAVSELPSGSYTFAVSGAGRASFVLQVTYRR